MIRWPEDFVVVDTETTGKEPETARIVEIAIVRVTGGAIVGKWSSLVNPGEPIPTEATEIHGITDAMVSGAPTFAEVAVDVGIHLSAPEIVDDDGVCHSPIAAYQQDFDRPIIAAEMARCGQSAAMFDSVWLDPLIWAREAQKFERGKKLVQVAERLGVYVDGAAAHRAAADAIMAAGVMVALRRPSAWGEWVRRQKRDGNSADFRAFFPADLAECLAAQRVLHAEQEASFQEWRSKKERVA